MCRHISWFRNKGKIRKNLNWLILRWLIFVGLGNHAGRTKNEHSTFPYREVVYNSQYAEAIYTAL